LDRWITRHSANGDIFRLRARAALARGDAEVAARWLARVFAQATSDESLARSAATQFPGSRWPAPHVEPIPIPSGGAATANGIVVDNGRRVITDASTLTGAHSDIFMRNGLGVVRRARLESLHPKHGVAILRLEKPYPATWSIEPARIGRASAGGLCFALGFPVAGNLDGSYPALSQGIVFRPNTGAADLMQVTAWLGSGQRGGPLFDSAGRLIGIARGNGGEIEEVRKAGIGNGAFATPSRVVLDLLNTPQTVERVPPAKANLSMDEMYQQLLPAVVLVVAAH
jgi:S1-C subfamily serine protease